MSFRDRVNITQDSAAASAPQPDYDSPASVLLRNVPATVRPVGGGEKIRGRQIEATVGWVVEIPLDRRFRLDASMRVVVTAGLHKDRVLEISKALPLHQTGVPPVWQLDCSEKVPA